MKKLILRIKKIIEKKPVMYTLLALSASIMMLAIAIALQSCSKTKYSSGLEQLPQGGGGSECTGAHEYVEQMRYEPTCSEEGSVTYRCKHCTSEYTNTLYVVSHNYEYDPQESQVATCYDYGFKYYGCTYPHCDQSYTEPIDQVAHEYVVESYTAPVCMNYGYIREKCIKCGTETSESIVPPFKHEYQTQAAKAPTCTEDGWEEYELCVSCGLNDKSDNMISALSHNMSREWTIDTEPTTTATGLRSHHCLNEGCEHKADVTEVPKLGYTDFLKYSESSNYCTVTGILSGYESNIGVLSIPETYNGKPVKYIAQNAFAGNTNITVVRIPSTVMNINYGAFSGCSNLTTLEVAPNADLQLIAGEVFAYCYSLKYVTLNEGLLQIEERAFQNCYAINELVIPGTVSMVCHGAFQGCTSLTSLTIPKVYDSAVDLYDSTYFLGFIFGAGYESDCSYYIPSTLETLTFTKIEKIDAKTLKGCTNLKNLYITDTVTSISADAFDTCYALELYSHDGIKYVGSKTNPYFFMYSVTDKTKSTYEIKDGTMYMAVGIFEDCTQLTGITLPRTITAIPDHAFKNCTSLATSPLTNSIVTIGKSAFEGCSKMTSNISGTIPASVKTIGAYAFMNCAKISSVVIGANVTSIGRAAFYKAGTSSLSFTISFEVTTGWRNSYGEVSVSNAMWLQSNDNYSTAIWRNE